MEKEALLKKVSLFSGIKKKALKNLAQSCVERFYKSGEILVSQGDAGIGLFIIVSGNVRVVKKTAAEKELEIATLGSGDFFGEITVLDGAPRSANVIALEDTACLLLTAWEFKAKIDMNPEIALAILPEIVKRFRETNEMLLDFARQ